MVDTEKMVKVEIWWDCLSDKEKINVYDFMKKNGKQY